MYWWAKEEADWDPWWLLQRRFKAAFEAYKERELPNAREEVCRTSRHSADIPDALKTRTAPWFASSAISCAFKAVLALRTI